jgi:LysM repeat protein
MRIAPTVQLAAATPPKGRIPHYLAPAALAALLAAMIVVIVTSGGGARTHASAASSAHPFPRNLPPSWTVRPGDTYALIAQKTKLTITQLEALNPAADPRGLVPGERLNLRPHGATAPASPPHPSWPGPHFWNVRRGESFGSIAAKTRISITTLLQLNPQLKPNMLQPGDRVRLLPGPDVVVDPGWAQLL